MRKLIVLTILIGGLIQAEEYQLYRDEKTGIVYTDPGESRTKINVTAVKSEKKEGSDAKESKSPEKHETVNTPAESKHTTSLPETKESDRKLKINGRIQVRSVAGQEDSNFSNGHSNYNAWDVNFRRLRFGFNYQGAKWWGGTLDVKLENLLNENYTTTKDVTIIGGDGKKYTATKEVKLRDSRGGIQEANIWLKAPVMDAKVYFGSHRLRFLREDLATSANLLTTERAFAVAFLQQWDIGTFLDLHPLKLIDKKYTYFLKLSGAVTAGRGTHEGYGRQRVLTETRSNTNPLLISPMLSWRIEFNPFDGIMQDGKMGEWKEGDEIFQRDLKVSLGISGVTTNELKYADSYDPNTRLTSYNPNGKNISKITPLTEQTTASGGNYNSAGVIIYDLSQGATNYNRPSYGLNAHTYDFTATWKGLYANGASTFFTGSAAGADTRTHHLTLGYNIPVSKYYLMPTVRYDFMKGDFDRNKLIDDYEIFKGYWVGLNFFGGDNHNFKAQLFYNILRDRFENKFEQKYFTNRVADANNNVIYFQLQVSFGENVNIH